MKTAVRITKNGRVSFRDFDLFPQGKWRDLFFNNRYNHRSKKNRTYAVGFDVKWCERTSEVAFEVFRLDFTNTPHWHDRIKAMEEVGATLWLKHDQSISVAHYIRRKLIKLAANKLDVWYNAYEIENHFIVKLDDSNTEQASLGEFKKLQLKRTRNQNIEILLKPSGIIAIPRVFVQQNFRYAQVTFNPDTQTVRLTLNGATHNRLIRKDGTFGIGTILREYAVPLPTQNQYLSFQIIQGNERLSLEQARPILSKDSVTLEFNLNGTDPSEHNKAILDIKRSLGFE